MGLKHSLASAVLCLAVAGCEGRLEPATKIDFKDKRGGQDLVGVGVRKKGPIKVYGVGMYVDPLGSRLALKKYRGKAELPAPAFLAGFGKTLVLKMSFGVTKEKIASALVESIKPRMSGGGNAIEQFEAILLDGCERYAKGGRACVGTEFAFAIKGSSLGVAVNGKSAGSVSSQPLVQALLKCYFDGKPVSPGLKATCSEGLLARV